MLRDETENVRDEIQNLHNIMSFRILKFFLKNLVIIYLVKTKLLTLSRKELTSFQFKKNISVGKHMKIKVSILALQSFAKGLAVDKKWARQRRSSELMYVHPSLMTSYFFYRCLWQLIQGNQKNVV